MRVAVTDYKCDLEAAVHIKTEPDVKACANSLSVPEKLVQQELTQDVILPLQLYVS